MKKLFYKTIYSKSHEFIDRRNWKDEFILPLEKSKCGTNDVYYYDKYDYARGIMLDDFIEDKHWRNLQANDSVKILICYDNEPPSMSHITMICETCKDKKINPQQIFFVLPDQIMVEWVQKHFSLHELDSCNAIACNYMMKQIFLHSPEPNNTIINKKFSVLSRTYKPYRLEFFLKLNREKLLKDFLFTFHNINPYSDEVFSFREMSADARKALGILTASDKTFIRGAPYYNNCTDDLYQYNNVPIDTISSSRFHVVIETSIESPDFLHMFSETTTVFVTEKTWRSIYCKKPFIAVASNDFLKQLRNLGFKTFAPLIDESYDTIRDASERMNAVVKEIKRLNTLPVPELVKVTQSCQSVCDYNRNVLEQLSKQPNKLSQKYNWLRHCAQPGFIL